MKIKLLALVPMLFVCSFGWGQVTFQKIYSFLEAQSVRPTADGGYIFTGTFDSNPIPTSDLYMAKTDYKGDIVWAKQYGVLMIDEISNCVRPTNDGGYILIGSTFAFGGAGGLYVVKTKNNGDTLWTKALDGFPASIEQTNDGGYVITGTFSQVSNSNDAYLLKLNSNGAVIWTKTYGGGNDEYAKSIKQTFDGGYIIAGSTRSFGAGNDDIYLIKTNATGDTLWTKSYGGVNADYAIATEQTTDSGFIIGGRTASFGAGAMDFYIIKTKANGDTLWTKTYGGPNTEHLNDIMQTTDSGYIITGMTLSFGTGKGDAYLIKTDYKGDTLWTKTYGDTAFSQATSARQTADGGYIVAGSSLNWRFKQSNYMAFLIKTDINGNSGCYTNNASTIIKTANTKVSNTSSFISSGFSIYKTNFNVSSGGYDSTICLAVGIHEQRPNNTLTLYLYPNPATHELTIKAGTVKIKSIDIYNVLGQKASPPAPLQRRGEQVIDVSALASGLYFVRVVVQEGVWVGRFMKE